MECDFIEDFHDNCWDYLYPLYISRYCDESYVELINFVRKNVPKISLGIDTPVEQYRDIIVCDQHSVIITCSRDTNPIMATYALNACVSLVLYDRKNKYGSLSHFDGMVGYRVKITKDKYTYKHSPMYKEICRTLSIIRKLSGQEGTLDIEYYVIGGTFGLSELLIHDLIYCMTELDKNLYNASFSGRNILGPKNQVRNFCFDTRLGTFSHFDYIYNYDQYAKKNTMDPEWVPPNILLNKCKNRYKLDYTYITKKKLRSVKHH